MRGSTERKLRLSEGKVIADELHVFIRMRCKWRVARAPLRGPHFELSNLD